MGAYYPENVVCHLCFLFQLHSELKKDPTPLCDYSGTWWRSLKEKKVINIQINKVYYVVVVIATIVINIQINKVYIL